MMRNIIGNFIGRLGSLLSLPTFDDGSGTKLLQWLFSKGTEEKSDGYTYVLDKANKGDVRDIRPGSALDFDGVDGVVTIPHSDSLTFGDGSNDQPFSITAWVEPDDATGFRILTKGYNSSNLDYQFMIDGSDKLVFYLYDLTTANYIRIVPANTLLNNTKYFVVGTYTGVGDETGLDVQAFLEDGSEVDLGVKTAASLGTYIAMHNSSANLLIGENIGGDHADGTIYEVRVHNTELTTAEIDNLVANPQYLTGHEVGIWHLDEEAGLTAFDSSTQEGMNAEYESDFSSGVDGFTLLLNTAVTNEGGALKAEAINGSGAHYTNRTNTFLIGRKYIISGEIRIPSTNIKNDGIYVYSGGVQGILQFDPSSTDAWESFSVETAAIQNNGLRFYATDGGSTVFNADGDYFEVRNIVVTPYVEEGKHGTLSGGVTNTTQDVVTFPNTKGYSEGLSLTTNTTATVSPAEGFLQNEGDYFEMAVSVLNSGTWSFGINTGNTGFYFRSNGVHSIYFNGTAYGIPSTSVTGDRIAKFRAVRGTSYVVCYLYTSDDLDNPASSATWSWNITTATFANINEVYGGNRPNTLRYIDNNGTIYNAENNWNGITWTGGTQEDCVIPASLDSDTPTLDIFGSPLTYTGKAPKPARLVKSHCLTLNGVDEYGVFNDVELTTFDISARIKTSSATIQQIFADDGSENNQFRINADGNFRVITLATVGLDESTTGVNVADGEWHKVRFTNDGTTLKIYVDDNEELSVGGDNSTFNLNEFGTRNTGGNDLFTGEMCDLVIKDNVDGTILLHYPLAEGNGLTAYDASGNDNHGTITGNLTNIWGS